MIGPRGSTDGGSFDRRAATRDTVGSADYPSYVVIRALPSKNPASLPNPSATSAPLTMAWGLGLVAGDLHGDGAGHTRPL